jgi:hypothetical protein
MYICTVSHTLANPGKTGVFLFGLRLLATPFLRVLHRILHRLVCRILCRVQGVLEVLFRGLQVVPLGNGGGIAQPACDNVQREPIA